VRLEWRPWVVVEIIDDFYEHEMQNATIKKSMTVLMNAPNGVYPVAAHRELFEFLFAMPINAFRLKFYFRNQMRRSPAQKEESAA
jgi:hypothetical protein